MDSDKELTRDEIAEKKFGSPFHHLSLWGQHAVELEYDTSRPKVNAPHNQRLEVQQTSPLQDMERISRMNESLILENQELFEENGELRRQLAEALGQV